MYKALLNLNAGTGIVPNPGPINVPEQMPGTPKLAQPFSISSGRTMENPGECSGGKRLACCDEIRCVSLQVLLDVRTSHRFCITGIITCCASIAYWAEPLDPYDHSIGEGVDCDDEEESAIMQWVKGLFRIDGGAGLAPPTGFGAGPAFDW